MSVTIKNSSRLVFGELKLIDGVEFWDILDLPIWSSQPGDIQYTTIDGDRFDLLANTYYQDPILMWVIAWANDYDFPPAFIVPNTQLVIPDPNYVKNTLLNGQNISKL